MTTRNLITGAALCVALLLASEAGAQRPATSAIRDAGKLFSPAARAKAEKMAQSIRSLVGWGVVVETIARLSPADAEEVKTNRREFFSKLARAKAKEAGTQGLYILVCGSPRHAHFIVSQSVDKAGFTLEQRKPAVDAFMGGFRVGGKRDDGLTDGLGVVLAWAKGAEKGGRVRPTTSPPVRRPPVLLTATEKSWLSDIIKNTVGESEKQEAEKRFSEASATDRKAQYEAMVKKVIAAAYKSLTAEEKTMLAFILKHAATTKAKTEAWAFFKDASPAERKSRYEEIKQAVASASGPKDLTAEEKTMLVFILKYADGEKAKKEAEDYFRGATAANRKKYYEEARRDAETPKAATLTAEEKTMLAYILKHTEGEKEKKEAEVYFKGASVADRKKYHNEVKKDVEGDTAKVASVSAEEQKMLALILKYTEGEKEKKEAEVYFKGASAADRKKYFDEIKKEFEGGTEKVASLSAEEKKWLDYILKNVESAKLKKEAEEYFKASDASERKAYYEQVKKEAEAGTAKASPLTAEEKKWLDYILKNVEGEQEKKEAEAYFKASDAAERKGYYEQIKKEVEGK